MKTYFSKKWSQFTTTFLIAGTIILSLASCNTAEKSDFSVTNEETNTLSASKTYQKISDYSLEEIEITLPNLSREYTFLYVSDLHIIVENEEIIAEETTEVIERKESFQTQDGMYSADLWNNMVTVLNSFDADAILLGGDMVDYASSSNLQCLKEGINRLKAPVMYVRADHDTVPFHTSLTEEDARILHNEIDSNEEIFLFELEDLCIMGINNSTMPLSETALAKIHEIYSIGKPIFILSHVPFNSIVSEDFANRSKEVWQDRILAWGDGGIYSPSTSTFAFFDMLYAEDTLFQEIFAGHLHYTWHGAISSKVTEHIFSPAYQGYIGVITIKSE